MNRENILFSIIGVGFGLFFGFVFANWANQRTPSPRASSQPQTSQMNRTGGEMGGISADAGVDPQQMQAQVQAAIKFARDNPKNFDAQMETARLFYQIQRYDDALEFLTRANALQPDNVETVVALGNVNYDAGRYEAAEKWYTAALTKKPDDINVRTDLGLTFLLREPPDIDRAITEFRASLQRDPKHEQSLQNLVVALTRKGNKAEAGATLAKLQAINPNNPAIPQLRAGLESGAANSNLRP